MYNKTFTHVLHSKQFSLNFVKNFIQTEILRLHILLATAACGNLNRKLTVSVQYKNKSIFFLIPKIWIHFQSRYYTSIWTCPVYIFIEYYFTKDWQIQGMPCIQHTNILKVFSIISFFDLLNSIKYCMMKSIFAWFMLSAW